MSKIKFDKYIKLKKSKLPEVVPESIVMETEMTDEVVAAIGLALSLHLQDVHDYEKTVLTMMKVMRPYSPWSSKIYGLRQIPFRIPRNYKQ